MARKTLDEFKKFIARGNVIDLAVGIVIGSAFTAIVQSLVKDIVNPLLGVVTGNLDFSNYFVALNGQVFETLTKAREAGAPVIAWGSFITAIINLKKYAISLDNRYIKDYKIIKEETKTILKLII